MATDISEEIRRQVADRANRQCEYCLISEEDSGFHHQVDHIVSLKHGGASSLENLALACVLCNRYKGTDIASIDSEQAVSPYYSIHDRIGGVITSAAREADLFQRPQSAGLPLRS